ncbi:hypothetical protein G210_2106, partial [Candida maltosa Xu316]
CSMHKVIDGIDKFFKTNEPYLWTTVNRLDVGYLIDLNRGLYHFDSINDV